MGKTKTVSINSTAAAALEDIACFDLAGWAENLARVAGGGHASRDEITEALWGLMPLIKQRQATIDATESGEVPKKLFNKHAAELTDMLAAEASPAPAITEAELREQVLGDRAVAIVHAPLDLAVARELVTVGRAGSEDLARIAAQVAESIVKEHARRNDREFPLSADSTAEPVAVAA